jgi:predicted Fe-Mo cluster-binding NifX family protein
MNKRVAISVRKNSFCPHFGDSDEFVILEVSQDQVLNEEYVVPPLHKPGAFPPFHTEKSVTHMIAGGMGKRALWHFQNLGITPIIGVDPKSIKELVRDFINDELTMDFNQCHHH